MKKTISNYETRERDVFSFNLKNLQIDECQLSEIGTFCDWDVKYKREGEWFVSNIKVFKHNSYDIWNFSRSNPSWKQNPIDGHPIKREVIQKLMRIMYNERIDDVDTYKDQDIPFTNYYRPTIIFLFGDGVALEWNIDELPMAWCPVSNTFLSKYFIGAWNPATQENPTLQYDFFYGLDPLKATRWEWKEPTRLYRGRNEDMAHYMNQGEYNEKDLH